MNFENTTFLRREEQLSIRLKALYQSYGFKEYKLSSFDEYSLYADNQSFLGGKDVISLSVGGKLLALRPDVTLSIVKNNRFGEGTQKLFYDEKVYRLCKNGGFSEVSQIGVEVLGDVDIFLEAELCSLVLKTLAAVSGEFVLDLSHTGITQKILQGLGLRAADGAYALECLEGKNVHDFERFARGKGLDEEKAKAFIRLMALPAKGAKKALAEISNVIDISRELEELDTLISLIGGEKINIDFSIGGDAQYYNGVVFKGYVKGIPHAVLTGGRYDKLLSKFSKSSKAMGFALYIGELCKYAEETPPQMEAALVYTEKSAVAAFKKAEKLRAEGVKLLVCKTLPEGFEGKIYYAENGND